MRSPLLSPEWMSAANSLADRYHGGPAERSVVIEFVVTDADTAGLPALFNVTTAYPVGVKHFAVGPTPRNGCRLVLTSDTFVECFAGEMDGVPMASSLAAKAQAGRVRLEGAIPHGIPAGRMDTASETSRAYHSALRELTELPAATAPAAVTSAVWHDRGTHGEGEVDSVLPRTAEGVLRGWDAGEHSGASLYVARPPEVVIEGGIGRGVDGEPIPADALVPWLCCSKVVAAILFGQLVDRGHVTPETRVVEAVPEFTGDGKDTLTFEQLLTHTTGIRVEPLIGQLFSSEPLDLDPVWTTPVDSRRSHRIGSYSLVWAWAVLGLALERLFDATFSDLVRARVFEPLGLHDSWIGMPPERFRAYGRRVADVWDTMTSPPRRSDVATSESFVCRSLPGNSGCGPIGELGRLGAALLPDAPAGDREVVSTDAAERLRQPRRGRLLDPWVGTKADWSLGLMVGGEHFGASCSGATFGHHGFGASTFCCDPDANLVIAVSFNGLAVGTSTARSSAVVDAVYADLGLGRGS